MSSQPWDVIVVGGGASGLLCAIHAGRRGRRVLVLEQGPKCGLKILVSGGGRCNFTNIWADPEQHFISDNEHFCNPPCVAIRLGTLSPWSRITVLPITKKLGQQFCDHSAKEVLAMLLQEAHKAGVEIRTRTQVSDVQPLSCGGFNVVCQNDVIVGQGRVGVRWAIHAENCQ